MRVAGVTTAAVLAVAAGALALVPLVLKPHHERVRPPAVGGATVVWAIPVTGGTPRQLLRLHGQYGFPAGLPDGSLALVKQSLAGASLWRFDAGRGRRLRTLPEPAAPVWSPSHAQYLVTYEPNRRIVIDRVDGTPVRTLTQLRGYGSLTCPSWAGQYIACLRLSRPASGWRLDLEVWRDDGTLVSRRRLPSPLGAASAVVAPDGRAFVLRPFRPSPISPNSSSQWTPDGRTLVYVDRQDRLVARGTRTRVLMQHVLGDFGLSADGRTVYVARVKAAVSIPK